MPTRKHIRLKGYDYSKAGAYFITICTQGRRPLFGEITPAVVGADFISALMRLNNAGTIVNELENGPALPLKNPYVQGF